MPEKIRSNSKCVFHLFVIKTPFRKRLIKHLEKNNISYAFHYILPVHKQGHYKKNIVNKKKLKITEKISSKILSLPMYPELKKNEINYVCKVLNNFE